MMNKRQAFLIGGSWWRRRAAGQSDSARSLHQRPGIHAGACCTVATMARWFAAPPHGDEINGVRSSVDCCAYRR